MSEMPAPQYSVDDLFVIETNKDFLWSAVPFTPQLHDACHAYGIRDVTGAQRVEKRNKSSELYLIVCNHGRYILRAVAPELKQQTEVQCEIVDFLLKKNIIQPLRSTDKHFTAICHGALFCAYREIHGEIFNGENCPLEFLLEEVIDFENALQEMQPRIPAEHLAALPRMSHRPEKWAAGFEQLCDPAWVAEQQFISTALSDQSIELIKSNRSFFVSCINLLAKSELKPALVHNDLQHANVLVSRGVPSFLDIEDICLESREIAIAHAVFKLLRHACYSGKADPQELRKTVVPTQIKNLAASGFGISSALELFQYGAYRIVSDIWEITDYTLCNQSAREVYDLEKRIHNLFELYELTLKEG